MLSVSASTLAGPATTTGVIWNYETLGNGTVIETNTQRVIGPTMSDGQGVVEVDSTGSQSAAGVITTTKSFNALTGAGLVSYGRTAIEYDNGMDTYEATTYSPTEVILPATLVAGTPYTEATTATEQLTGVSTGTVATDQSTVLTLEPAMQSVTVPAGTFKAYVIDESITTSSTTTIPDLAPIATGPITNTGTAYYAPNVGLVELAIGSGQTELTSFTANAGGGGGGPGALSGGGTGTVSGAGTGALSGGITGALPATSLIAGQNANISQNLTLTDTGTGALDGAVSVGYFLSTGTSVNSSSIPLPGGITGHVNVKPSKHVVYHFHLKTVPAGTPNGTYHIVAQVTNPTGAISDIASASEITVAPAQIDLGGAFVKASSPVESGKNAAITFFVTNNGNVPATGSLPIQIDLATDASGDQGVDLVPISTHINVKAGKTTRLTVHEAVSVADGSYYIFVKLDPANTFSDVNIANNSFQSPTPALTVTG